VRQRAADKDALRQTQIALATVPGAIIAVTNSPLSLLGGQAAAPSEYPLSRMLRHNLTVAAVGVNRRWHTSTGRALRASVAQITARITQMMGLLRRRRVPAANVIENRYVQPLTGRITVVVAKANRELTSATRAVDQSAWNA